MPRKYAPMGDEMDSETYAAPVTAPDAGEKPAEAKPSVDQEEQMEDTALVPTKILSPEGEALKEGDEIVVQVVSVHGDQAVVKYAPHKEGEEEEETPSTEEGSDYEKDFQKMDNPKGY